jgi:F0F1-type ATP synthase gamma subunit
VILMTADKGLAGSFNANVIRVGERSRARTATSSGTPVGNKARNATKRLRPETVALVAHGPDKLVAARRRSRRA